jgi:hypothetical protein
MLHKLHLMFSQEDKIGLNTNKPISHICLTSMTHLFSISQLINLIYPTHMLNHLRTQKRLIPIPKKPTSYPKTHNIMTHTPEIGLSSLKMCRIKILT